MLQARSLHGPAVDMLLARTTAAGTSAWYLTDRLGSVRDLASTSGSVINHVAYDGFGKVLSETNPANGDRFKFTGREQDAVTGLQYNRARYYDAAIGRWTQEDPIGFAAGDANLYRYVGNGPTNFVDPSGLYSDPLNEQLDRMQRSGRGFRPFSPVTQSRVSRQAVAQLQVAAAATEAFTENLGSSRSLDTIQAGLDVVGTAEPTPFADTFNAFVSLARGNLRDALLTLAGVIPYAGDGFKSLKYTDEVAGVVCTATTRIDVLPSNQLVSRFDTVTTAPNSAASRWASDPQTFTRTADFTPTTGRITRCFSETISTGIKSDAVVLGILSGRQTQKRPEPDYGLNYLTEASQHCTTHSKTHSVRGSRHRLDITIFEMPSVLRCIRMGEPVTHIIPWDEALVRRGSSFNRLKDLSIGFGGRRIGNGYSNECRSEIE
jgi:RHS repeat-associated protein